MTGSTPRSFWQEWQKGLHGRSWRGGARGMTMVLLLVAHATLVSAQQLRGTVRDSARGEPVAGAVIVILDALGKSIARTTTDPQGAYRVTSAIYARRMRVLRIGFRPQERALTNADATIDIALVSIPLLLGEVHVTAASHCAPRKDRAAALSLLEQVRAGLLSTVVARSQNSATMTLLLYERRFDGGSDRVVSQTVRKNTNVSATEPFVASRNAAMFVRDGFREESGGGFTFYGPDAETLIDEAFASGYCFHIMDAERSRQNQVGLGFEAAEQKDGKIDIAGALWVDTLSRTLHDMEFRYVGLERALSALKPGGQMHFEHVANGVSLIDRWALRLVSGREEYGGTALSSSGQVSGGRVSRLYAQEAGGEIARATWPNGAAFAAPLGTLRLRAVNKRGQPAPAGTMVQLVGTDYQATADSTGTLEIPDLLPGPYTISIIDQTLAAFGVPLVTNTRFVAQRDSRVDLRLEVETAEDFVAKRCDRDQRITGAAYILGRVMSNGQPVKEAHWTIRDPFGAVLVEGGQVGEDGLFQWCQFQFSKRVEIEVWQGERRAKQMHVLTEKLAMFLFELPPQ